MKQIIMKAFDKKYKVKPGISVIGNTEQCNIQVPLPVCFKLNYDSNILWIQPIINIHRINGQGDAQLLRIDKEYELDLTTGQKQIIVQEQTLTFEYARPKIIKINLIKQNKPNLTILEPPINKQTQIEQNEKPITNSQKSKGQPKHYLLVQNYIKQMNGENTESNFLIFQFVMMICQNYQKWAFMLILNNITFWLWKHSRELSISFQQLMKGK
ncbi:unnamed protein product [Paramecium primaurelia]|uniref:Uncharacterized protein n=1 Tax=Paramecium primaurelia TaxID=5886 RepID=A0A8S1NG90_PARPR|nr:unnamed protein product [Paramecium primaurelia]